MADEHDRLLRAVLNEPSLDELREAARRNPPVMWEARAAEPAIPANAHRRLAEAFGLPDDRVPAGALARLYAAMTGRAAPDRPEPGAGRWEAPTTRTLDERRTAGLDDPTLPLAVRTLIEQARAVKAARGGA